MPASNVAALPRWNEQNPWAPGLVDAKCVSCGMPDYDGERHRLAAEWERDHAERGAEGIEQ